ncbi:hypothetical protein J5X98_24240 [Leptothermofonsia sichuanensis E412]|uniref:hypothetical protein n=1 Tax=Leptothermofonsia sichuanensis TaxID=2917832 RepID=UPI001CA732DE|nr:hypothetical protein [Leptothermofonsia sichuanensis]QZZ20333.1 hypothetical protein J5X98_24240 [Leptothermofonsia sichuanensis E412]
MRFLSHNLVEDYRWQNYKRQELISDSVRNDRGIPPFTSIINWCWRGFIKLLTDELVDKEQQVEYIKRCWSLDEFGQSSQSPANSLKRLWLLME